MEETGMNTLLHILAGIAIFIGLVVLAGTFFGLLIHFGSRFGSTSVSKIKIKPRR
jgi:hypothetical protein